MPDEFELVWVEDTSGRWRVLPPGNGKLCRSCREPAVVALNRGRKRPVWWCYCADHMYGRRVEGGMVMHQIHPDNPAAQAARRETVPPLTGDFHA